jgi:pimeloyl-ACP methyl ester carboxylesterase
LRGAITAAIRWSDEEWARVFVRFGPQVPGTEELARRIRNPELDVRGMELFRSFNVLDQLPHICCPTLVCVGELDPVTPVATAREIADALLDGIVRFEVNHLTNDSSFRR